MMATALGGICCCGPAGGDAFIMAIREMRMMRRWRRRGWEMSEQVEDGIVARKFCYHRWIDCERKFRKGIVAFVRNVFRNATQDRGKFENTKSFFLFFSPF